MGNNAASGTLSVFRSQGTLYITDFMHIYRAGKMAVSDQRSHLYNPSVQLEWLNKLIAPEHVDNGMLDQNVPYFYLVAIPISFFPIRAAHVLWDVVTLVLGLTGTVLLARDFNRLSKWELRLMLVGIAASFPSCWTLFIGQTSYFVLAAASFFFWFLLKGKDLPAGICLASIIKVQYLPFFLIPPLLLRRFRVVLSAVVTLILYLVIVGLTMGWQNLFEYPAALFHIETNTWVAAEAMISVRSMLSCFMPQTLALPISLLFSFIAMIFIGWFWWLAANRTELMTWAASSTIFLALLASAHTFEIDCLLLAVAAALTIPAINFSSFSNLPPLLRAYAAVLLAYPLVSWVIYLSTLHNVALQSFSYGLINAFLLVCSCLQLKRLSGYRTGDT